MASSSVARTFFDKLVGNPNPVDFVKTLIGAGDSWFETDWLEFKDGARGIADAAERWSKAAAAFANTGGGVLIWGVECNRKANPDIDVAHGLSLVCDCRKLAHRLREIQAGLTDPHIIGIEVLEFPQGAGPDGIVVCYVPDGSVKPYRSEIGKCKQYWIRVGANTNPPSRPLLASLFNPGRASKLSVVVFSNWELISNGAQTNAKFRFDVHNDGPASAEELVLAISADYPGTISYGAYDNLSRDMPFGSRKCIAFSRTLHPSLSHPVASVVCTGTTVSGWSAGGETEVPVFGVKFAIAIMCRDRPAQKFEVAFSQEALAEKQTLNAIPTEN